ncbi:hypothetical protein K435DRAFT_817995 [Dendrothele bispora CBS 962.96]|uniref:Helicase ATP-binding domain-containing protein n=1 Tax=Dendrothele bispora (strain CBS 962.96) TaxID=1314807 RepID=A0A4S8MGK3_DENBC|nr:hypothetical protein K435DRAFT_817995 [Dendrothele bispora CBS 962.96]
MALNLKWTEPNSAETLKTTGEGKSALFIVPILVHLELSSNPTSYPSFKVQRDPVVMVITPTKGLATSIIHEATAFGIQGLSYCHETISKYRIKKIDLESLICECKSWNLICIDPEHLSEPKWRHIIQHKTYCSNLILFLVDEAHLVRAWGTSGFRPSFESIGAFVKGCLPDSVSIAATTATCAPGDATHALGRKAIIHVNTIPEAYAIYEFLWDHIPPQYNRLRRMRMYHSTCPDEYNHKTFDLIDSDPFLQVVIGTPSIQQGINRQQPLDSIAFRFPDTLDDFWQGTG